MSEHRTWGLSGEVSPNLATRSVNGPRWGEGAFAKQGSNDVLVEGQTTGEHALPVAELAVKNFFDDFDFEPTGQFDPALESELHPITGLSMDSQQHNEPAFMPGASENVISNIAQRASDRAQQLRTDGKPSTDENSAAEESGMTDSVDELFDVRRQKDKALEGLNGAQQALLHDAADALVLHDSLAKKATEENSDDRRDDFQVRANGFWGVSIEKQAELAKSGIDKNVRGKVQSYSKLLAKEADLNREMQRLRKLADKGKEQ